MRKPLIVIAGPTAGGKTKTSIELAKILDSEVISADSMQVYKYMNVGTAKPTLNEMQGIKHYVIDELYPDEIFNVTVFQQMAREAMDIIYSQNKIPIITGGTGFYINAIVKDTDFTETKTDISYRNNLYALSKINGTEYVHQMLKSVDPQSAEVIHPNNVKKVVRALEYFNQTGESIALHNKMEKEKNSPYNTAFVILTMDRNILYERIEKRIDEMIDNGLIEEVNKLLNSGYDVNLTSMQAIGYKEIALYLKGAISLDEAILKVKLNTRHFAKRQLTWFRQQTHGLWLDVAELEFDVYKIIEKILNYIEKLRLLV